MSDGAALARILGRPVYNLRPDIPLAHMIGKRVLVTGAEGSIGAALTPVLQANGSTVLATDIDTLDVTHARVVWDICGDFNPEIVFHLAGAKHAPAGEEDPLNAVEVNTLGTRHILESVGSDCARVVTASTCKAANPETAYGASKLIAERMTLNAGHAVARFYNVVETSGNVFEIWRTTPPDSPILYTSSSRYFVAISEAVGLLLWSAVLPPARYSLDPGQPRFMWQVAEDLYPDRDRQMIPLRRGDRETEPRMGSHESWEIVKECGVLRRIMSPHDESR